MLRGGHGLAIAGFEQIGAQQASTEGSSEGCLGIRRRDGERCYQQVPSLLSNNLDDVQLSQLFDEHQDFHFTLFPNLRLLDRFLDRDRV